MNTETRDGPTPHGGVSSRIYYADDDGNLVEREVATRARIVEYDETGGVVWTTYGRLDGRRRPAPAPETPTMPLEPAPAPNGP